MIAYLILSHGDTETLREAISTVYHPDNLYCVCSRRDVGAEMIDALDGLRHLGNVHLVLVPPTSWGTVLDAYLRGIDFCLNFDKAWSSLIVMSGTDVAIVPQERIFALLKNDFKDKIVLQAKPQPLEVQGDADIIDRLLRDPFAENLSSRDNAVYNAFPFVRPNYAREGSTFYAEGGAMRAGWSQTSHFVTALIQNRRDANGDVYSEAVSPFLRRALEVFFQKHMPAGSSVYGIFPRDFCTFLTSAPVALDLFSLIRQSFAAEELFFATLASSEFFRNKVVTRNITFRVATMDRRLTIEDVVSEFSQESDSPEIDRVNGAELSPGQYLFARKAPSDHHAEAFFKSVRSRFGIRLHSALSFSKSHGGSKHVDVIALLFKIIDLTRSSFAFGVLGSKQINRERFTPDGLIEHEDAVSHAVGNAWVITDRGVSTDLLTDKEFTRFESFRVKAGKFLLFGYWLHHPLATLCLAANLEDVVRVQEHHEDGDHKKMQTLLSGAEWEFWLNQDRVDIVRFNRDRFISSLDESNVGVWRVLDGKLVAVGLGCMPLATFDTEKAYSTEVLCGVSWGSESPREPCILRRL